MERILVLDASQGEGMIALVKQTDGAMAFLRSHIQAGRGGAERLAGAVRDLLDAEGWPLGSISLIAAVIGPGSFTGLRASLALAHGMALGQAIALQGVRRGEAFRQQIGPVDGTELWCVGQARRDRIFLERCLGRDGGRCETPQAYPLGSIPHPDGPVLLAGDASGLVAGLLQDAGFAARQSGFERPDAVSIARVASDQQQGRAPGQAALPFYVDPPEAKLPAAGLRPGPG